MEILLQKSSVRRDDAELVEASKEIKKQADLLLKSANLIALLEKYGKVQFSGSYSYDLMLNPDIDLEVINPDFTREKAVALLNEIIQQGYFYGYLFFDWVAFHDQRFPRGYYIGLKIKKDNLKWKIDIWCLNQEDKKTVRLRNLIKKRLSPGTKKIILKLKNFRNQYHPEIESIVIYKAVFNDKVASIKEFAKLQKQKKEAT